MRKSLLLVVLLSAVLLLPAPASAKRKPPHAALAPGDVVLSVASADPLIFHVATTEPAGSMWVAVICQSGDNLTVQDQGVDLDTMTAGPFRDDGDCRAYVWVYPDAGTPVSNMVLV